MENKKSNTLRIIFIIIALLIIIGILVFLGMGYYKKFSKSIKNPIATIEVKDYGTIKVELYPDIAPQTVSNFVILANNGYYNGLKFHRVVKDFMIQGGDKKGDGTGKVYLSDLDKSIDAESDQDAVYTIKGEFTENDYNNNLKLNKGIIAMARGDFTQYSPTLTKESYNSAGSQFFILTTDKNVSLTGFYAGFGKVIEGMDVVEKIAKVKVVNNTDDTDSAETEKSKPKKDVIISSISVDTFGVKYEKPETLEPFDLSAWFSKMYNISY